MPSFEFPFSEPLPLSEVIDLSRSSAPQPKLGIEVGAAREVREAEAAQKREQRETLEKQREQLAKQRKEREGKEKEEREKEARAREAKEKEAKETAAKEKEKKDRETREKEAMDRLKESREREARENSLGGRRREGEASGSSSRIANLRKEVIDDEDDRGSSRRRFDPENRRQIRGNQVQPELVEVSVNRLPLHFVYHSINHR